MKPKVSDISHVQVIAVLVVALIGCSIGMSIFVFIVNYYYKKQNDDDDEDNEDVERKLVCGNTCIDKLNSINLRRLCSSKSNEMNNQNFKDQNENEIHPQLPISKQICRSIFDKHKCQNNNTCTQSSCQNNEDVFQNSLDSSNDYLCRTASQEFSSPLSNYFNPLFTSTPIQNDTVSINNSISSVMCDSKQYQNGKHKKKESSTTKSQSFKLDDQSIGTQNESNESFSIHSSKIFCNFINSKDSYYSVSDSTQNECFLNNATTINNYKNIIIIEDIFDPLSSELCSTKSLSLNHFNSTQNLPCCITSLRSTKLLSEYEYLCQSYGETLARVFMKSKKWEILSKLESELNINIVITRHVFQNCLSETFYYALQLVDTHCRMVHLSYSVVSSEVKEYDVSCLAKDLKFSQIISTNTNPSHQNTKYMNSSKPCKLQIAGYNGFADNNITMVHEGENESTPFAVNNFNNDVLWKGRSRRKQKFIFS